MLESPYLLADALLWLTWGAYWAYGASRVEADRSRESVSARLAHLLPIVAAFWCVFGGSSRLVELDRLILSAVPWRIAGIACTGVGLGFAVWARIHLGRYWSGRISLKEGHRLIRTGPYRLVRHPIYTGFLTGIVGGALVRGAPRGALAVALVLFAYGRKIRREEAALLTQFGDEYRRFQREVRALIPFVL